MQRSVKHFTPRRRGERGGTGAAVGRATGAREQQGTEATQKDMRRLQLLESDTEREREIYLLLPDAIKHLINESFQLLARDFTLTCPSIQGTVPYVLYYMFLAAS